jgi:hypothetical protein
MAGIRRRCDTSHVTDARSAVRLRVRVEDLAPSPLCRHAHTVLAPRHGREIARHEHRLPAVRVHPQLRKHALCPIVGNDPAESVGGEVACVQRALASKQRVEVAEQASHASVHRILEQVPRQRGVVVPLFVAARTPCP